MFIYNFIVSYYKLFLYFNLCLSVTLDSFSCSFTTISHLINVTLVSWYSTKRTSSSSSLSAYPHYDIYNITTPSRGHTLDSSVGWVLRTITSTQLINGGGMVFAATFNNISDISWRSVLLVEETGLPGKKTPTCHKTRTNFITFCCIEYTSS